jgi:CBS domain-containing protein
MESQVAQSTRRDGSRYTVGEVMRSAVTTVETGSHLAAAAYLMSHAKQTALVVVDQVQRPVAIISERDLLRAVAHGEDAGEALILDWMNRDPRIVAPDMPVYEAAGIMREARLLHLPVVADSRVVGIVAVEDIADALIRSVRLASAVVFVSDLARSLEFYQSLLRYAVTVSDVDTALLAGPSGSQLYLHATGDRSGWRESRVGLQWVVWTAGGEEDLERCADLFRERGVLVRRDVSEGISRVEGRDPDGQVVLVTYPGPERAPRCLIPDRVRQ